MDWKKQQTAHDYFEARNFRGTLISFILNNFGISWHFNFAVWPKYHNLRKHLNFAVVLKIKFLMCVSFQYFRNFGKRKKPKSKLKYIFYLFLHTLNLKKYLKHQKKVLLVWKYRHLRPLSLQLDLRIPRLVKFSLMKIDIYSSM